jgi:hypothetical protein
MPFSNTHGNDILALVFNSTALPAAYTTSLYFSLHTADPGLGGDQTTNEVNTTQYQNYVRVTKTRSGTTDFTVAGKVAQNATQVLFATAGAASTGATLTHLAIGVLSTGAGRILHSAGTISPNITISNGVQPSFAAGAITITYT